MPARTRNTTSASAWHLFSNVLLPIRSTDLCGWRREKERKCHREKKMCVFWWSLLSEQDCAQLCSLAKSANRWYAWEVYCTNTDTTYSSSEFTTVNAHRYIDTVHAELFSVRPLGLRLDRLIRKPLYCVRKWVIDTGRSAFQMALHGNWILRQSGEYNCHCRGGNWKDQ